MEWVLRQERFAKHQFELDPYYIKAQITNNKSQEKFKRQKVQLKSQN